MRQLLTENVWLFFIAAVLGVVLAKWGGEGITSLIPFENRGYLPNYGRLYVDFSTLAYSVANCASVFLGIRIDARTAQLET